MPFGLYMFGANNAYKLPATTSRVKGKAKRRAASKASARSRRRNRS